MIRMLSMTITLALLASFSLGHSPSAEATKPVKLRDILNQSCLEGQVVIGIDETGGLICEEAAILCPKDVLCCDPSQEPGTNGNPFCFEGHTCCGDGTWACNDASGNSSCPADVGTGEVCITCCDPSQEPGMNGNPFCIEGHTCCGDGSWRCNDGSGNSTCPGSSGEGEACPVP